MKEGKFQTMSHGQDSPRDPWDAELEGDAGYPQASGGTFAEQQPFAFGMVNPDGGSGQHSATLLQIQRDLAAALENSNGLRESLGILLAAAMRLPGFDCGGVYLWNGKRGFLKLIAHHGLSEKFVKATSFIPTISSGAELVRSGGMPGGSLTDIPPEVASMMAVEGLASLAVISLCDQGSLVATLNVFSRHRSRIGKNSRVALESLAAQAESAIALERARSARQATKRELLLAVEGAQLGTWNADLATGLLEASPRARELHGIDADTAITVEVALASIHPEDRSLVSAELERILAHGGTFSCEYRTVVDVNGELWVASEARRFDEEGRMHGIVRDITRYKVAEQALQEAHDLLELRVARRTTELEAANAALREESLRLDMALAASQAGTWTVLLGSEIMEWDNRSRELFGFEHDVVVSTGEAMERLHPDDRENLLEYFQNVIPPGGGEHWSLEFRIQHPALGERWVAGLGRIERDAAGLALRIRGINLDISQRKYSESKLSATVDFSANVIRSMQNGFSVLDLHGVALDANPAFCEMTGFSREELVGVVPPHPYWPPEEYTIIQDALAETINGTDSTFELTFMRKNGQRFPVVVSAFAVLNRNGEPISYAATVKDITERRQVENAMRTWNQVLERRVVKRTSELKQSEDRFRQLVDATFEGIVITEKGIVIDGNPQITAMLRCELSDMIGRPATDFIAPESRALVSRHISEGYETAYEITGLRKDGTTVPMEAHGRMMSWRGKATRVTAVRDLTAEKLAETRHIAQKAELDQALRLALVSEVSAGIIHQIGQPLSAIGMDLAAATARLKSGELKNGDSLQILEGLAANVASMRNSVIHLRALANPEQPNRQPMNFNDMVLEALGLVHSEGGTRHFEVVTEMAPDLPELRADAVQLSQVVINLVRNAFDASAGCPAGRRRIHVGTRAADNDTVELSVSDSGTGIDPSVMGHLYSPFFTTKAEGFGVGLRLSRTIVEAHGGTIGCDNNPDGFGATFRVLLPLNPGQLHSKP